MLTARFAVLTGMVVIGAVLRLIPHPPNFTPILAIALFGGAHFADRRVALVVPLAAMAISDLFIGLHGLVPIVYGSFALITCFGFWLRHRRRAAPIAGAVLASSILFFVTTNFGVWAFESLYPRTLEGLIACYIAAIPFFGNTLLGDALYTAIFFGSFALAEKTFPVLHKPSLEPAQ